MENPQRFFFCLHNVQSRTVVVEFVKIASYLGAKNIIVTRASSSAAQSGVPEAYKIAYQKNVNLFYLKDLTDAIELIMPKQIFFLVSSRYSQTKLDLSKVLKAHIKESAKYENDSILFFIGGLSPGFSKIEMSRGESVYLLSIEDDIGPLATLSILLYELMNLKLD